LDCDDNTLAFERNYEFLGVAFRGEIADKLPILCALLQVDPSLQVDSCCTASVYVLTNLILTDLLKFAILLKHTGPNIFFFQNVKFDIGA
jgi:hypothetical protein